MVGGAEWGRLSEGGALRVVKDIVAIKKLSAKENNEFRKIKEF